MPSPSEKNPDADYDYANAYFYFLKTLETLSEDALRQCEVMGHFNVAWELRDDAIGGANAVLGLPGGRLSTEQREAVGHFLAALKAVPESVVNVDNTKEEHLRAMSSPFWASVRTEAKSLQKLLEPETQRTRSILWPMTSDPGRDGSGEMT
jgi:hypothetical protein